MSTIAIAIEALVDTNDVIDLLKRSTLAERRNIRDASIYSTALRNSNLIVTARDKSTQKLVGYARCLTDFSTICFIADLAVDSKLQKQNIGRKMMEYLEQTQSKQVIFVLLSAPKAMGFYPKLGYKLYNRCYIKTAKL